MAIDMNSSGKKAEKSFTYDDDGNLTSDGRWTYTWDAENRLIRMESVSTVPNALKRRLDFVYDYMGRRVGKKVYTWNTQTSAYSTWPATDRRFAYDGWNLIVETQGVYRQLQRIYTWGLDLSGSLQGAGGIGGLVFLTDLSGGTRTTHYPGYDGNGNLTSLTNATNGTTSARYEYSPYGQLLTATGSYADTNPIRFSTKYTDEETQLAYFGYRYYNSDTGRWLNRDPINDAGFIVLTGDDSTCSISEEENQYRFIRNNTLIFIDKDGRNPVVIIVIGGVAIGTADAAAIAAAVSGAICFSSPDCVAAVSNAVGAVVTGIKSIVGTACSIRCRFGNHPPHHPFLRPKWGIPPWKKCYMNHLQINCWLAHKSESNFLEFRVTYGPCYKFVNGKPPVTH